MCSVMRNKSRNKSTGKYGAVVMNALRVRGKKPAAGCSSQCKNLITKVKISQCGVISCSSCKQCPETKKLKGPCMMQKHKTSRTWNRWRHLLQHVTCPEKKEIVNLKYPSYKTRKTGRFIWQKKIKINMHIVQCRRGKTVGADGQRGGRGGILCEILPKVYGRLKGLKAWRKLDQGESSPNFHYFQVVWLN